ncbi:MAG: DNA-directed RNA polymerase subunit H [Candidatus Bathyarchaeota archaeon]|nr:DNA-directed RNA polymerase subunit H [Candidatus Termiticorpusculum sp.]
MFNIFEHSLVPFHEILNDKEKTELLTEYKIQPFQIPQIKSGDPAVKVIGAKPGDVLKITRKSITAGKHITYRYVVE